jgi:hypothetical protein
MLMFRTVYIKHLIYIVIIELATHMICCYFPTVSDEPVLE